MDAHDVLDGCMAVTAALLLGAYTTGSLGRRGTHLAMAALGLAGLGAAVVAGLLVGTLGSAPVPLALLTATSVGALGVVGLAMAVTGAGILARRPARVWHRRLARARSWSSSWGGAAAWCWNRTLAVTPGVVHAAGPGVGTTPSGGP